MIISSPPNRLVDSNFDFLITLLKPQRLGLAPSTNLLLSKRFRMVFEKHGDVNKFDEQRILNEVIYKTVISLKLLTLNIPKRKAAK